MRHRVREQAGEPTQEMPAPRTGPVLAYMSDSGVLLERQGEYLGPTRVISGGHMSPAIATETYGPLIELVAIDSIEAVNDYWLPEPEAAGCSFDGLSADPLAAFAFDGKWLECGRRTPEGPWCEWRAGTRLLSLSALCDLAAMHVAEVHGG